MSMALKSLLLHVSLGASVLSACAPWQSPASGIAPFSQAPQPSPSSPGSATERGTAILPTRTPDLLATSYAWWTQVASTGRARGAVCRDGYFLEYEIDQLWRAGPWTVFTCTPESFDYSKRYTAAVSMDLSTSWTISHEGFDWSDRPGALLTPSFWTPDGIFVYLIPETIPAASGFDPLDGFLDVRALYRLDLTNGSFTIVLPETQTRYACSLSPSGRYLAFTDPAEPASVHIRDMPLNDQITVDLGDEFERAGAYAWSLDSTYVIFAAALPGWREGQSGVSLFTLDVGSVEPSILASPDNRLLIPVSSCSWASDDCWIDDRTLALQSLRYPSEEFWVEWAVDVTSGTMLALATRSPPADP